MADLRLANCRENGELFQLRRLSGRSPPEMHPAGNGQGTTATVSRHSQVGGPNGSPVNDKACRSSASPATARAAVPGFVASGREAPHATLLATGWTPAAESPVPGSQIRCSPGHSDQAISAVQSRADPSCMEGLDHYGVAMNDPEGNEFDIN